MANRPVFMPSSRSDLLVETAMVDFTWFPGMAPSQKQKSVQSLHEAAKQRLGIGKVLEVSTKSTIALGQALSAFNLQFKPESGGRTLSVEAMYQSSKVFVDGGPYVDIRGMPALAARQDPRLKSSGSLVCFRHNGIDWPLEPKTLFYDWLYLNVLHRQPELVSEAMQYQAFTDIEFNPKKSINCQAYSVALYCALARRELVAEALVSGSAFRTVLERYSVNNAHENTTVTPTLI